MNTEDKLQRGTGTSSPDTSLKESIKGLRLIRGTHKRKITMLMKELDSAGSLTDLLSKSLTNQISSGLDQVKQYDEMIVNIMEEYNVAESDEKYYTEELEQHVSYSVQAEIELGKYVDSNSTGEGEQYVINSKDLLKVMSQLTTSIWTVEPSRERRRINLLLIPFYISLM